jgi:hypothetical protein
MNSNRTAVRCVCVAAAVMAARGQTQIDLRTQGKNIDFSAAASTRPSKTGTSLPAACSIGETYLKTDATAGKNLYVCTASGVWTVQGVEIPNPSGKSDQVLTNDGAGLLWRALGGDISGAPGAVAVTGFGGRKLSSVVPLDGQFLRWNGISQQWEATTLAGALSVFGRTGAITAQSGDYSFAQISGTITSLQLPAANGDLSGALSGPTVVKIQGRPLSSTTPSTGQFLGWDGAQWTPQSAAGAVASVFGRSGAVTAQGGDYSFGQIAGSVATGQLPGAGGDLSGTLTSATVSKLQNRPVAASAPSSGQVLTWDGTQWKPQTPSGSGSGDDSGSGLPSGVSWDGNTLHVSGKVLANEYDGPAGTVFAGGGAHVAASAVPTPASGSTLFFDAGNADKLSRKDSTGAVFAVEGSGGIGAPGTPYSSGHTGGAEFTAMEQCRDDSFTITTDFQQAAQTGAVAIATIPAFGDVRTVRIIEDTTVTAGGTVTGVAACIGTSGTPCGYAGPFALMGTSNPTFKSYTASGSLAATDNGTQALQLQLSVTGGSGNLSALTGGVVKTRVCAVVGQ